MQISDLLLTPQPRSISAGDGFFSAEGKRYIRLNADEAQKLMPAARRTGIGWEITASPKAPEGSVGLTISVGRSAGVQAQGYKLDISPRGIEIEAVDAAGAFYGACTLAQIVRQCGATIPCLSIVDWPDFPARGVMLDISRDKVPTQETLYGLVDLLAGWKINQVQLYTEHTFAYLAHPIVWAEASPMTGEEILALDAYCRERFVELVPNQNSFGHMERWLKHDEYRQMAEAPYGCDTAWGRFEHPFSLCPGDDRSLPFIDGLYDELLPHFTSNLFNVGCDETVDLGRGRSEAVCAERGSGRVYLDFLLGIQGLVEKRSKSMMFWGDIIMHHPELIGELPEGVIALEWGYEADHPFKDHGVKFAESGIPFYVCPGTSSWCSISGRTENAIGNVSSAVTNGLENGAIGVLNTDWGDGGHWQPLSTSYAGYMLGAIGGWSAKADLREKLAERLSLHAFGDATGESGKAFLEMGDLYRIFEKPSRNCTWQWRAAFAMNDPKTIEGLTSAEFQEVGRRAAEIGAVSLDGVTAPDAAIVRDEFAQLVRLSKLAAEVGRLRSEGGNLAQANGLIAEARAEHERVWLLRNRIGGLKDSLARLQVIEG